MEVIQDMGMTNEQWYGDVRKQIEDWEEVKELLEEEEKEKAIKKINRIIKRLTENLEK